MSGTGLSRWRGRAPRAGRRPERPRSRRPAICRSCPIPAEIDALLHRHGEGPFRDRDAGGRIDQGSWCAGAARARADARRTCPPAHPPRRRRPLTTRSAWKVSPVSVASRHSPPPRAAAPTRRPSRICAPLVSRAAEIGLQQEVDVDVGCFGLVARGGDRIAAQAGHEQKRGVDAEPVMIVIKRRVEQGDMLGIRQRKQSALVEQRVRREARRGVLKEVAARPGQRADRLVAVARQIHGGRPAGSMERRRGFRLDSITSAWRASSAASETPAMPAPMTAILIRIPAPLRCRDIAHFPD